MTKRPFNDSTGDVHRKRARDSSPCITGINLPSVNGLIESPGYGIHSLVLESRRTLKNNDTHVQQQCLAMTLSSVFQIVFSDEKWQEVLNPAFTALTHCQTAICENVRLANEVGDGIKTGNWEPVFHNPELLWNLDRATSTSHHSQSFDRDQFHSKVNLKYFKTAFEDSYPSNLSTLDSSISNSPTRFLTYIDKYFPKAGDDFYNRSLSVVQSSGMGKSRLVDQCAKLRFTIPFNLRDVLPAHLHTYPPPDHDDIRSHLSRECTTIEMGLELHYSFLETLFCQVLDEIKGYEKGDQCTIASRWHGWMNTGSTPERVGTHRTELYRRVVSMAWKLQESRKYKLEQQETSSAPDANTSLHAHHDAMIAAAGQLVAHLQDLNGGIKDNFMAIVYFDEAHTLQELKGESVWSSYSALSSAISALSTLPILFVFLSTNSSLHEFSPQNLRHDSLRVQHGQNLIAPYYELPYNIFAIAARKALKIDKLTLKNACKLEHMSKFGRPLWHSTYLHYPEARKDALFTLAMEKLGQADFKDGSKTPNLAQLAVLDCRVSLDYDNLEPNTRSTKADLVKSYMQCVGYVSGCREYVISGYPSEPMLAEAAARILNDNYPERSIHHCAPEILSQAFHHGFLDKGERGELVGRTFLTVAHDMAILKNQGKYSFRESEPRFHRPILLLDLLENLVAPEIWETVRNALPFHAYPDSLPLYKAFANAWVNFSHFTRLSDYASFSLASATRCIERGIAMQGHNSTPNQDFGIPILMGDPATTPIIVENMSIAQFQIKNSARHARTDPDPTLVGEVAGILPILSIVMQLGVYKDKEPVVIATIPKGGDTTTTRSVDESSPSDINRRHYVITLSGCTEKTYSCIPKDRASLYQSHLKLKKNRLTLKDNLQSMADLTIYRDPFLTSQEDLAQFNLPENREEFPELPENEKEQPENENGEEHDNL